MITEGIVIDATFRSVIATLGNIVDTSKTYELRVTTKLVLARKSAVKGTCPWFRRRRKSRTKGYK